MDFGASECCVPAASVNVTVPAAAQGSRRLGRTQHESTAPELEAFLPIVRLLFSSTPEPARTTPLNCYQRQRDPFDLMLVAAGPKLVQ